MALRAGLGVEIGISQTLARLVKRGGRHACRTREIDDGIDLYYELTGPDDGPVVLQFGGGLFGRHNFGFVNDGFRENGFRLLSFDARGYGASLEPARVVHDRRVGRRRRRSCSTRWASTGCSSTGRRWAA